MSQPISNIDRIYRRWFQVARKVFFLNPELSREIVKDILFFSRKTKTKIPRDVKRFICKKCFSVLLPGINLRVRLQDGHVVYLCKGCKTIYRYPYVKEQKEKRKK